VIRVVFPVMTEERRKELVKQIKKIGEDAKVALRNGRRDALDSLKKMKTGKEISEDEYSVCESDVEKAVVSTMGTIEGIISAKEKDLMSI
jgi:ribosome recycling factor